MKKKTKKLIFISIFFVVFFISAIIRIQLLGSAPTKLMNVEWDESVGTIYKDLEYQNDNANKYDLYVPTNLDKNKVQNLIVYIHGGSFNSGSKEDGDAWCKYYASKGYLTATIDYTLQTKGLDASIHIMNTEIENAVKAIKDKTTDLGYNVESMAVSGVSAGGTLAMNLGYNQNSAIPVKFVFQLAAPTYFEPDEWSLLKKVNKIKTNEEFLKMMTGFDISEVDYVEYVEDISPASIVNKDTVPTLIGYGLIDHCVPPNQKYYLMDAFDKHNVNYDYIEFPNSNHGMYNDLDKMQEFLDKSLEYCERYFNSL